MKSALIFAAGEGERWGDPDNPKQLIPIHGEPIICRTIRQVKIRGHQPIVVTHHPLIAQAVDGCELVNPSGRRWLVETILTTARHWGEDSTVFLLGDVVYSKALMDSLLADTAPLRVWGTAIEVLAVTFSWRRCDVLRYALETALQDAESHPEQVNVGKLWRVYRAIEHLPLMEHAFRPGGVFQSVEDWSTDIDSPALHQRFMEHVVELGLVDDLPKKPRRAGIRR